MNSVEILEESDCVRETGKHHARGVPSAGCDCGLRDEESPRASRQRGDTLCAVPCSPACLLVLEREGAEQCRGGRGGRGGGEPSPARCACPF